MALQPSSKTTEKGLIDVSQIERRDSQLWWLAITIIILLTITVTTVDSYSFLGSSSAWKIDLGNIGNLNGITVRLSLILSSFLICTYFRECARSLVRLNRRLIGDVEDQRAAMERKNLELSRMKQLSEALMTRQDLNSALEVALQMATEVVGADSASVMLLDEETQHLRIVAAKGLPEHVVRDTSIRIGEGFAGLVAQEGEPLMLDSDDLDDRLKPMAHRTDKVLSAVITPIKVEGRVRGVINVTNRRDGSKYTVDDLNTIATLAQQASMVIQKIELYQSLEQQVLKLSEALEELSKTQAELTQADKLASIGQLAGGVAHEINNPLHIMLGRAEMLLESVSPNSPEHRDVQILYEQVERLTKLVRNLLKFARRGESAERRPVDLNEVIAQTLELVETQMTCDNITISLKPAEHLPPVWGSVGELQQVFLNITLNAYQAMKHTGGELEIITHATNQNVEVIFSDTGPGISSENLSRLFEPFFSTKPEGEGSGLGLSVSYGIVQAHGGLIDVKSKPGAGARFTIRLPLPDSAIAA
ncbi:MAG: ATP-binding protein [Armatimonadota bacterium]|nr:ATP-binding protein [Armatimonadota bacterium]